MTKFSGHFPHQTERHVKYILVKWVMIRLRLKFLNDLGFFSKEHPITVSFDLDPRSIISYFYFPLGVMLVCSLNPLTCYS